MLSEKETTRRSKLLSLVLRHEPAHIGISLDEQGWVDVPTLLAQLAKHQQPLTFEELDYIVDTNAKQRFRFNDDRSRIRASQGHSVDVELGYTPVAPPEVLYHGTAIQHKENILRDGLRKMARHHVHLSADVATARTVGQRHGRLVVFAVAAGAMHRAGHSFFQADNGVWLTDEVPAAHLQLLADAG
ncbi:RNA 2'-phosphotransferase [Hymenobacter sp. DH14]|uniref:Probable RNA 2'-phosphotransferase n=1 Tax=Hymenobacter cyanobacteriorum TaxID=2926463 RepID=A0A9X1VH65_9BACT|nr:RNA 2'-phosphotransferase [Hymenobacter cyanobacteriorum]MCI1186845.1 RNA 2'-phosphotransferase [Hymenobacter cyanobacteriorum]